MEQSNLEDYIVDLVEKKQLVKIKDLMKIGIRKERAIASLENVSKKLDVLRLGFRNKS